MNTYCWGRRFLWPGMNGTYTILTPWLTMVTSNPYLSCGDKGESKMSKTSMSLCKLFLKMQYQCTRYKRSTRIVIFEKQFLAINVLKNYTRIFVGKFSCFKATTKSINYLIWLKIKRKRFQSINPFHGGKIERPVILLLPS